ncbi:MAG: hypothetical protein D6808_03825 [Candidatus Dadabacteria bacterium]|nr:MAG: hypothetical protein D6808_03825 [Candidatus Dadabacteria bacterium]
MCDKHKACEEIAMKPIKNTIYCMTALLAVLSSRAVAQTCPPVNVLPNNSAVMQIDGAPSYATLLPNGSLLVSTTGEGGETEAQILPNVGPDSLLEVIIYEYLFDSSTGEISLRNRARVARARTPDNKEHFVVSYNGDAQTGNGAYLFYALNDGADIGCVDPALAPQSYVNAMNPPVPFSNKVLRQIVIADKSFGDLPGYITSLKDENTNLSNQNAELSTQLSNQVQTASNQQTTIATMETQIRSLTDILNQVKSLKGSRRTFLRILKRLKWLRKNKKAVPQAGRKFRRTVRRGHKVDAENDTKLSSLNKALQNLTVQTIN